MNVSSDIEWRPFWWVIIRQTVMGTKGASKNKSTDIIVVNDKSIILIIVS